MTTLNNNNKHHILNLIRESDKLVIACLCAAWCDTCNAYRSDFDKLAQEMPQYIFLWIDIEDNPEFLGDVDIENFPTILIQDQTKTMFFGEQLPYTLHLKRLIESIESKSIVFDNDETPPLIVEVLNTTS